MSSVKWVNKQRVLVFASRGISHRDRHLMQDIRTLMPHSKPESKMERSENLFVVNEMCEMKNCNKCIMFEGRQKRDLYMWISNVPQGPSAKFLVFGTPNHHPKSQPFTDHVMTFTVLDNRIWFRNFQILSEDGALAEIGPRFVLNPVKIFKGSFGGEALWDNSFYVSPAKYRQQLTKTSAGKYINRLQQKVAYQESKPEHSYNLNPLDEIFTGDALQKAQEIVQDKVVGKKVSLSSDSQGSKKKKKLKARKKFQIKKQQATK
uniref:Ribosome biogenesis protein BRX1 homolog n=1 Tax=Timema californicum TaxID=61474 RepID=A0A7R9P730_TIMCA|nr:unnamed protein product [Timema californicum]